jgi:hypothetical protein
MAVVSTTPPDATPPHVATATSYRSDGTCACQAQKSVEGRHRAGIIGGVTERVLPGHPLPDESLDALVTVLDEIRLGRSRSRSELVARTGLGRAIVAQRVGELLDRGLVIEGEVGPSTGGRPPRQLSFQAGGHEHRRRGHEPRRADLRSPR